MSFTARLLLSRFVTRDVRQLVLERPPGLDYTPGQGIELSIPEPGWEKAGRPFTPTATPDAQVLELTVKRYPEHQGVTDRLHRLAPGTELRITEPFGTISYRGPGVFIAGGAGITPFLAILRDLAARNALAGNALLFSNQTPADVICERELSYYLGERCILTCTRQSAPGYDSRRIDRAFLEEKIERYDQHFYVCGPPRFVEDITAALTDLGASPDALVLEE